MTGWFWQEKLQIFPHASTRFRLKAKFLLIFEKSKVLPNFLNSEIDREEALDLAKQQIEDHHRFLLQQDVDRIVEIKTEVTAKQIVYLHAPIWFIKYEYKGKMYQLIIDGTAGTALKGDIPIRKILSSDLL